MRKKHGIFLAIVFLVVLLVGIGLWWSGLWNDYYPSFRGNELLVIAPYWFNGTWVFDDPAVGLRREPFVAGVPEMIDALVKDIPDARNGFRLTFSARPFPGFQKELTWLRGDSSGNYYQLDDPPLEGWICPATLYVKAEPIKK
jgi:hypothetical protein